MKRFVAIIAAFMVSALCLVGCNQQVIDLNYEFKKAYVKIGEEWTDIEVKSWCDYDGEQLQLKLKDGTVLVVSSVNCILYNGTLPRSRN